MFRIADGLARYMAPLLVFTGDEIYESLASGLRPLVLPFVVGNMVLGALAGLASFVVLRWFLTRRKRVAAGSGS